ncbi:MAG TPA: hypothetical protein VJ596_01495, partial [Gemmatimonadaceae bacterium]|nr:hypothetical protein [Gemmatimonadaceae bacterium]
MQLRRLALPVLLVLPVVAAAQAGPLPPADSALVGRILLAEDARDSAAAALAEGARHGDPRVRMLARRALGRIRDPLFAARDSFPAAAAPRAWTEPAWRLRYRALAAQRDDCVAIRRGLADSVWHVRLRAAALLTPACARDTAIVATLAGWIDALPRDTRQRPRGGVSWHAAAHAALALARIAPAEARHRLGTLAVHPDWHVRLY